MYTFECWENGDALGKDAAGNKATSRTNYHIKKYIYMGLNWGDASVKIRRKSRKIPTVSYVTDTLTFRNRIRDGVNEWQDENPDHYH